jgi:hypothetical protein
MPNVSCNAIVTNQTTISTYHEYILEAIYCLRQGLSFCEHAKKVPADIESEQSMLVAEVHCRYSFVMIASSLEASANALLLSLQLDKEYFSLAVSVENDTGIIPPTMKPLRIE